MSGLSQRNASKEQLSCTLLKIKESPFPNSVISVSEFVIFYLQRQSYGYSPNQIKMTYDALREKCPYSELFWSVFSGIWMRSVSTYLIRLRENMDQNNSKNRHFSRSDGYHCILINEWIKRYKT